MARRKALLVVNNIHNLVSGNIISGEKSPTLTAAADQYHRLTEIGHGALTVVALAVTTLRVQIVTLLVDDQEFDSPKTLGKRYRAEKRFELYGLSAILISMVFLVLLFMSIIKTGYPAFFRTVIKLDITFDPETVSKETLSTANYSGLVKKSLRELFPHVSDRGDNRQLYDLISSGAAFQIRETAMEDPQVIGKTISLWVPANDDVDMLMKGQM